MILCIQPLSARNGVLQITDGTPSDEMLDRVLSKACMIELSRTGLTPYSNIPAAGTDLSYLLVCRYQVIGSRITIVLDLRTLPSGESFASREFTRPLDLQLDTEVAEVLRGMIDHLALQEERIGQTPRADEAATPAETAFTDSLPTVSRPLEPTTAPDNPVSGGPAFGVRGAPVLIVGKACEYFRYSASTSAFAGYRFPISEMSVETGLQIGYLKLFPSPDVPDGTAFLVTAGLQNRAESATGAPVRMFLRAGGGIAVLTVESEIIEQGTKAMPYIDGGIGTGVLMGRRLTIGLEIGSIVVFERIHPIIGIAPALSFSFGR